MPFGMTSPKKQVNRGRLRMMAAQNLSLWGSETPYQIQWAFFISSFEFQF
jgi:hypothetical protein